jgi:membrane protein required for colicin V production
MMIDIVFILVLIAAIVKGLRRGLIVAVFSFVAFIAGIAAALKLSTVVADYLKDSVNVSARWLPVLSFILVFIVVALLVRLGANLIEKTVELALLGWVNKLGGILFYCVLYIFLYSVVLFYAQQLQLINENTIAQSVTWPWLQPMGPWVIDGLGNWVPVFKDMFTELKDFFGNMAQRAPH